MFESTGVLKTALWRPTVFLELQSSGTTSRLSPKIGPVIGLSVAVGCQLSGGPENHPGERDHFASESEMSPQIGLNGAVGGPRSGGLPEATEEAPQRCAIRCSEPSRRHRKVTGWCLQPRLVEAVQQTIHFSGKNPSEALTKRQLPLVPLPRRCPGSQWTACMPSIMAKLPTALCSELTRDWGRAEEGAMGERQSGPDDIAWGTLLGPGALTQSSHLSTGYAACIYKLHREVITLHLRSKEQEDLAKTAVL
ncbi:unnamed protein product [Boreogadus saida]